jgi:hypothetical protein
MALTAARLKEIAPLPATVATVYSYSLGTTTYIKSIILHNTNSGPETVYIYNVPGSGFIPGSAIDSGSNANKIYEIILTANETKILEFQQPIVMPSTFYDTIQAYATDVNMVTIQIYGATE